MTITSEISLKDFQAWSGGENTLYRVISEGKCDILEAILEDLYPDGMDETELNDLLRFDEETVFNWCGIPTENELKEELEELQEELEDLLADYDFDCIGIADWERKEIWEDDYKDKVEDLKQRIKEIEEELNNI